MDNCSSCISPYYILNNSCLAECPNNYYPTNGNCLECNASLFQTFRDAKPFCLNLITINFTVQEISNPTTFKIIFSTTSENFTTAFMKQALTVNITKLPLENYQWSLVSDLHNDQEFYFTINYFNCSLSKNDGLQLLIIFNETMFETSQYFLENNLSEINLTDWMSCPDSDNFFFNSSKDLFFYLSKI